MKNVDNIINKIHLLLLIAAMFDPTEASHASVIFYFVFGPTHLESGIMLLHLVRQRPRKRHTHIPQHHLSTENSWHWVAHLCTPEIACILIIYCDQLSCGSIPTYQKKLPIAGAQVPSEQPTMSCRFVRVRSAVLLPKVDLDTSGIGSCI